MNSITYFEIQATDLEGTVDFYREVFGWRITQVPGMPVPYWRIETEGISGGLLHDAGRATSSIPRATRSACSRSILTPRDARWRKPMCSRTISLAP